MGTILFWLMYIISAVLLYTIIFKTYDKTRVKDNYSSLPHYEITDNDTRHKYPLWFILISVLAYFIPIVNVIFFILFMTLTPIDNVYFKSFLTKEY